MIKNHDFMINCPSCGKLFDFRNKHVMITPSGKVLRFCCWTCLQKHTTRKNIKNK